jgi:hypothetical protein
VNVSIALSSAGHPPFAHGSQGQHRNNRCAKGGHNGAYQGPGGLCGCAAARALQTNETRTDQTTGQAPQQDGHERNAPGKGGRERTQWSVVMGIHTASVRLPGASKPAE